ncbi:MAG TPA: hypothetical protein VNW52_02670 [Burkholderiaceae bacterium]|jgi:hypothetical protein|nr:hypothetical protein [Burkholderiaceae bacterium]
MSDAELAVVGATESANDASKASAAAYAEWHHAIDTVLNNSVRIPGQPAWIIVCGYHIGEIADFCAFSSEFVKAHGHGIILVARGIHMHVAQMYMHNFLKVVAVTDQMMTAMLYTSYIPEGRFELDQPISACWIDRGFRQHDGIRYLSRYAGRGGISETDLMRLVLRLPWNAKMEAPRISLEWEDQSWQLARQVGLRVGRSVLLCPINNTARKLPDIFWTAVAERLIEQGFAVFTNVGGLSATNGLATMPIAGTTAVDLPIHLAISFAHFAGRVITGGNGMSFLMMLARLKSFKITQVFPKSKNIQEKHSSAGERAPYPVKGAEVMGAFQYLCPELCVDAPFNEFILPFDESPEELSRLGRVVADQDIDDPACIRRYESNGKLFVEEHDDWLRPLT